GDVAKGEPQIANVAVGSVERPSQAIQQPPLPGQRSQRLRIYAVWQANPGEEPAARPRPLHQAAKLLRKGGEEAIAPAAHRVADLGDVRPQVLLQVLGH